MKSTSMATSGAERTRCGHGGGHSLQWCQELFLQQGAGSWVFNNSDIRLALQLLSAGGSDKVVVIA